MNGSSRDIVGWVLAACAMVAISALGCGGPDSRALVLEDVETGQSRVVVCNEYQTFEDRELYVVSAMNRKLYYFPELAAAINMSSVSDCDEARAFVRGYHAYRDAHPHFDANQPRPPAPFIPDDPNLQSVTVTDTVTKLGNGVPPGAGFAFPNESVVRISTDGPNRSTGTGANCTGTFIAKNWILTAAHCMNVLKDKKGNPTVDGNTSWTIYWSDATGAQVHLLNPAPNTVKQMTDPFWMDGNMTGDEDLALLYLDKHVYDLSLPPATYNGAAMRVSLSPPKSSDTSFVAGWGPPAPTNSDTRTLTVAPAGVLATSSVEDFSFGYNRSSSTDAAICHGDSGGPVYRNQTVGGKTVPILLGVNSGFLTGNPSNFCSSVGERAQFARIDLEVQSFIEPRMNLIYGTGTVFQCRPFLTGTANAYAECWGIPCTDPGACAGDTEYCSRPGSVLNGEYPDATCPVCGFAELGLGTGCDCIFGQCLSPLSIAKGF